MTTVDESSPAEQALEWLALRIGGTMVPADRRAFDAWLASSPQNAAAYAEAETLWARLDWSDTLNEASLSKAQTPVARSDPGQRNLLGKGGRHGLSRRGFATMAAGLGAVAVTPLALRLYEGETRRIATDVGEIRHLSLDDGTRISLGGRSALSARMGAHLRAIRIDAGEAYFNVARDEKRVFTVIGPGVSAEALGTAFEVRLGESRAEVFVEEGRVRVTATASGDHLIIAAGERALVRAGKLQRAAGSTTTVAPWRYQRFSFIDQPLAEVVAEVNRYYQPGVTIGSLELGQRKVTAAFTIDQIPQVLESLSHALGGQLVRRSSGPSALEILLKN